MREIVPILFDLKIHGFPSPRNYKEFGSFLSVEILGPTKISILRAFTGIEYHIAKKHPFIIEQKWIINLFYEPKQALFLESVASSPIYKPRLFLTLFCALNWGTLRSFHNLESWPFVKREKFIHFFSRN